MAEPAKPQVKKPPEGGLLNLGGPGRNRTTDTRIICKQCW